MTDVTKDLALPDEKLVGLPDRFQPRNLTELMTWSKLIHSSALAPKGMNEAAIVLAVQMGSELRISPTQALQNIAVINGRPSIWGDLGLALFKRDASFATIEERAPDQAKAKGEGVCKITMKDGAVIERRFTREDAKTAGLYQRSGATGPWTTYEGRMLQMRARWFAMRDADPGVFKGCSSREEVQDYDEIGTTPEGVTIMRPRSKTSPVPSAAEVEKFAKETKVPSQAIAGATATSAAVDRSKLVKVLVGQAAEKTGGGKTFYSIWMESSSGGKFETTTFDTKLFDLAKQLKGQFALIETKTTQKGDKVYLNLVHLEPVTVAEETEAPPDDIFDKGNG
jgi:hypothetical protein